MKKEKQEVSILRSSAAEYLTFITATGESDVNAVYFDENVWLTQKMMGLLYNVETHTINYHLKKIFTDGEIDESAVIRKFRITAPNGKIQKFDVVVAKNYLTKEELSAMARIVNAYLDLAELRAEEEVPMTMEDWAEQFEGVLRLSRKEILTNAGTISAEIAEQHALSEFEKYRVRQDRLYQSDFDRVLLGQAEATGITNGESLTEVRDSEPKEGGENA